MAERAILLRRKRVGDDEPAALVRDRRWAAAIHRFAVRSPRVARDGGSLTPRPGARLPVHLDALPSPFPAAPSRENAVVATSSAEYAPQLRFREGKEGAGRQAAGCVVGS